MLSKIPLPKLKVESSYTEWKSELLMWTVVCGYFKKEQRIIVLLQSLCQNQKVKKVISTIALTDLNKDDGLNVLLDKLNEFFKTEQTQYLYYTCTKFNNFSRSEEMDINEYVIEFEYLNDQMLKFELKLPDKLLCLKLLDGASLNTNQMQMTLSITSALKYRSMKAALKWIFIRTGISEKDSGDIEIEQESIFYTKLGGSKQKVKLNPINKHGQVSQCSICNSKMH